jgi:hypothetical protein
MNIYKDGDIIEVLNPFGNVESMIFVVMDNLLFRKGIFFSDWEKYEHLLIDDISNIEKYDFLLEESELSHLLN